MSWLQQLSLVLFAGSLAVFAEQEKTLKATSSGFSGQEARLLTPLSFSIAQAQQPTYYLQTQNPYQQGQANYPGYFPNPCNPYNNPSYCQFNGNQAPSNQQPLSPIIVLLNANGTGTILNAGSVISPITNAVNNAASGAPNLIVLRSASSNTIYPYDENKGTTDAFDGTEATGDDQKRDFYYNSVANGLSGNLNGFAIINNSEEDNNAFTVNTNNVKLPLGIQLVSNGDQTGSSKKNNNQEALFYFKNIQKGRKLKAAETK